MRETYSLRFAPFRLDLGSEQLWRGEEERPLTRKAFAALEQAGLPAPDAVGHRVVHGGTDHTAHERVDAGLGDDLRRLAAYTPLHVPAAIQGMDRLSRNSQARQSLSSVMIVTNNLIRRYRS